MTPHDPFENQELPPNTDIPSDNAQDDIGELSVDDNAQYELDTSSLEDENTAEADAAAPSRDAETLFKRTVLMIESGELDEEQGVMLLQKAASDGCASSALYLGDFYANPKYESYNPTLAYDNYLRAAELGSLDGCYKSGLCASSGFGCEKREDLALEIFSSGARHGHTECVFALGVCLEFGIGCEINYTRASDFYEVAAEQGHIDAINNLGGLYFYGHGVEEDRERAVALYKQAASLGSSNAECRLGICFEEGANGEVDHSRAFEHYRKAAKQNNKIALYRLALCYDKGIGTEQNFAKAYKYYCRAAEAGSFDAMYEAGKMSLHGRGTKKDLVAAYKMFLSASDALPAAEFELGNCLFVGLGTVRNRSSAYARYLSAYEKDPSLAGAAFRLGLCNLKGLGCEKNESVAYKYFTEGATIGSPEASYMKGECEFFGVGVEKAPTDALASFALAITNSGDSAECAAQAMVSLGLCYERGLGVDKDAEAALRLYKKASDLGDANAMYRTGHLMLSAPELKADYSSARIYILRAARKDHLSAMLTMGAFAAGGKGVQKNFDDAIRWYKRAVTTDISYSPAPFDFPERFETASKAAIRARIEAQYRLGMILARHKPSAQGYIEAFELISLAAAMGHKDAMTEITKIFVSGGDLKAYYESPFSHESATFSDGNPRPDSNTLASAMNKLGNAFSDGKGMLKKNPSAAVRCYKISAELGHIDAAYHYGWCLRHGVGVRENNTEAVKWLKLSADMGNISAAYSYGLCCEEGAGTGIKNRRDALTYYRKAAASGHAEASKRYIELSDRDN